jgi:hypothetical protein
MHVEDAFVGKSGNPTWRRPQPFPLWRLGPAYLRLEAVRAIHARDYRSSSVRIRCGCRRGYRGVADATSLSYRVFWGEGERGFVRETRSGAALRSSQSGGVEFQIC